MDRGKPVASICHGQQIFALLGFLRFVVHIPDNLPLDSSTHFYVQEFRCLLLQKNTNCLKDQAKKLGLVELGGLGHLVVKFGKAFGLHVNVIITSPSKEKEARECLGVDDSLLSTDPKQMKQSVLIMLLTQLATRRIHLDHFLSCLKSKAGDDELETRSRPASRSSNTKVNA